MLHNQKAVIFDTLWNLIEAIYFLEVCPIFVCSYLSFGKRYENKLKLIFDQWPKFYMGLKVESEIQIVKKLSNKY